ncbi:methylphosphotriester-DNA--protein-cysteine methyltransferase [Paenibacillus sp. V4I5]|nr:methylphosphotriester-DNA--protein-cysteine methyltransferase [Paenibacillus sp. V4I5]
MTFVEYARARRMGLALKSIRSGETIIYTQLASGYDSSSGLETLSRASWVHRLLG